MLDYMLSCYGLGDKAMKPSDWTRSNLINYSCDTYSRGYKAETAVQYTAKELHVARACYLNNNHNFNANDRNINNYNSAVRGIVQLLRLFLLWTTSEICGRNYAVMIISFLLTKKQGSTRQHLIMFLTLKKILNTILCCFALSCCCIRISLNLWYISLFAIQKQGK